MSNESRAKQIRTDKVRRDAASKDRNLRIASGAVQVAGVGLALANPLVGFAAYTSGVALVEKNRAANRRQEAADVARINRAPAKVPGLAQLSDAYRGRSKSQPSPNLAGSEAQRFQEANAQYVAGRSNAMAPAAGQEPGVREGGRGFANPNTQRAAQAAKGREWSGKTK